jgi:hypothetical protein
VQLQARRQDGVVTTSGLGGAFWYELPDDAHIQLVRAAGGGDPLELRASLWPLGQPQSGPSSPVADPGPALTEDVGHSFVLDAGGSHAFGGRHIVKYVWTQLS